MLLGPFTFLAAQTRTLTGTVLDETGQPLPGASVLVKNTEQNPIGTITDFNGGFEINIADDDITILVSFIGYKTLEVSVEGKSAIEITMSPDTENIAEVVVTALGIERDKKALGYSVQNVDGESLSSTSRLSPLRGLKGQVSGVNISSSGNGPGGTTSILIRGASSLTGDNDPLYVIDGVPLDNTKSISGGFYGGFDYGNAANDINPDDIESISVLKGGAASALYGSMGQNGVVMITTKKGSQKEGLGVEFSSSFEISNPLVKPDFQTEYSQGSNGKYDATSYRSWGAKMVGQDVTNFLNETQKLTPNNEQPYDEFLRTGSTWNNTVTINSRGDKNGVYFSASRMDNKSMLPNSNYKKNSITIRYDSEVSEFLKLDAKANYVYREAKNRPNLAASPDNTIYLMNMLPRSVTIDQLSAYQTPDGYPVVWTSDYKRNKDGSIAWRDNPPTFAQSPLLQNPYWATDLNINEDNRSRFIGFGELNLDFQNLLALGFKLNLKVKAGLDYYTENRKRITAQNTYYKMNGLPSLSLVKKEVKVENYDILITGSKSWDGFRINASVGGNLKRKEDRSVNTSTESELINKAGPYVIQNFKSSGITEGIADMETQSIYGLFSVDYKSKIFLDATFRNDWNSTLSSDNWSYFYPSLGVSWIINESLKMPIWINYLKLRSSYAAVGNGGSYASARYFQYGTNQNQYFGLPYAFIPSVRPLPNLKPEHTQSIEVGIDASLFSNKLSLDLAYFESGTKDQIFQAPIPPSSGFGLGFMNAGHIKNSGIEVNLSGDILSLDDLKIKAGLNVTRAWNKVKDLHEEVDLLYLSGAEGMTVGAKYGEPVGVFLGKAYDRDENGNLIINEENLPGIKKDEDGVDDINQILGKAYPDWLLGLNGSIGYKNLLLSFKLDSKLGHDIYSVTNQNGAKNGTLDFTTTGRDEWEKAKEIAELTNTVPNDGYWVEGVKNGVLGRYPVDPQKYWDHASRVQEQFVYDASFVRFSQLALHYSFSNKVLKSTPFKGLSLGVSVNNLMYLYKKTDNISPESSFGTANSSGYEMFSFPEARTMAVNLNVKF